MLTLVLIVILHLGLLYFCAVIMPYLIDKSFEWKD